MQRQPNDSSLLLTAGKAARRWGVSPQTVRNICGSGFLQAYHGPTSSERTHYRFTEDAVREAEQVLRFQPGEQTMNGWANGYFLAEFRDVNFMSGSPWSLKGRRLSLPPNATTVDSRIVDGQQKDQGPG